LRKDELSSDEEGESVLPLYDISGDIALQRTLFHPNPLPLIDSDCNRPPSILSQSSSHSLGSEGDLTLSNTSASQSISPHVNLPQYMNNDIEEQWNAHVSNLMNDFTGKLSSQSYQLLSRIFQETFKKVINLTRDSCELLPHTSEQYRVITSRFLNFLDIIASQIEFPFVFVVYSLFVTIPQLIERHRLGILEIHEHWETFSEKRNHLLECVESIRSSIKLDSFIDNLHSECNIIDLLTDLCKCLYKMHFQLMLLIESYLKLVSFLRSATNNPMVCLK
jgi:hypothetical protein